jgi:L-ascorbate metabolism protein UlaG (beta-lactamase superfamily)
LNGTEAATLARDVGAQIVIPCHYDMFEFNTATPDEFVATARQIQQPYKVLLAGEHWKTSTLN